MALKDSGMRIRIEKELREAFVEACRTQNLVASNVIRDFMRNFSEKQIQGQTDLFVATERKQK